MNDNPYVPAEYWGHPRKRHRAVQRLSAKELRNLLRVISVVKPSRMLEVGSGWGRLYLALDEAGVDMSSYVMCDFTSLQRTVCYAMTGVEPDAWDGGSTRLPYNDNSFPLVVSFDVMLHVPPDDIAGFIAEHLRVASRYVFVATLHKKPKRRKLASHCFVHPYTQIFQQLGVHVVQRPRYFHNRVHWVLDTNNDKDATAILDHSDPVLP